MNRKQRRAGAASGQQAVVIDVGSLFSDAVRLHQSGDLDHAERLYRRVLEAEPKHADSLYMRGLIASSRGRHGEAVRLLAMAVSIAPGAAAYHANLGIALQALGRLGEAADCFRRAEAAKPGYAREHLAAGRTLRAQGKGEAALSFFRRSVDLDPGLVAARIDLGDALFAAGDVAAALVQMEAALAVSPDDPEALRGVGTALSALGRAGEAVAPLRRAVSLSPLSASACTALGGALMAGGDGEEADECFRAALALDPSSAWAHLNHASSLLATGRWREGWDEYEWRWQAAGLPQRRFHQPRWDGAAGNGTLLLWAEQGLGDTLQFLRYASVAAALGWTVILEVPRPLARLCQGMPGVAGVVAAGDTLPDFDAQCPLLSLPRALSGVPGDLAPPYLSAAPALAAAWRERLSGLSGRRVGVVWRGSMRLVGDGRSMSAPLVGAMLDLPGVSVVSLQKGATADEVGALGPAARVVDAAQYLGDFAETAAVVACLDLVVSVDTAACHLAGGLGAPVWTLLPVAADWRWMRGADSTPWYPDMRLFRRAPGEEWDAVAARVRSALADWAGSVPC